MYSIFNHVLGPVMRGPSSSHTAASHRIGKMVREMLGGGPSSAVFTFDRGGSYGRVFRQQGSDLAFTTGLMGWPLTDERFFRAAEIAKMEGLDISFVLDAIRGTDHPNDVEISVASREGRMLRARARSLGGGLHEFNRIEGWPVRIVGDAHDVVVLLEMRCEEDVKRLLERDGEIVRETVRSCRKNEVMLHAVRWSPPSSSRGT